MCGLCVLLELAGRGDDAGIVDARRFHASQGSEDVLGGAFFTLTEKMRKWPLRKSSRIH